GTGLRALRGLELRAARAQIAPQRGLLVGRSVPGARAQRALVPAAAETLERPGLGGVSNKGRVRRVADRGRRARGGRGGTAGTGLARASDARGSEGRGESVRAGAAGPTLDRRGVGGGRRRCRPADAEGLAPPGPSRGRVRRGRRRVRDLTRSFVGNTFA